MLYAERLELFNKRPDYLRESNRLLEIMKPTLEGTVLDIGCGLGGMINTLKESGVNVFGVEPVRLHLSRLAYGKAVLACGEALPFRDQTFSAVYYMHSAAHIQDFCRSLQEASRVLKSNGTIFIVTPNAQFEALIKPAKALLGIAGRYEPDKTVIKHYSPEELGDLMSDYFDNIKVFTFGKFGFQRLLATAKSKTVQTLPLFLEKRSKVR